MAGAESCTTRLEETAGHHRRGDLLYRLDGDEFVLLLTNTDRKGAEVALAKLRAFMDQGSKST